MSQHSGYIVQTKTGLTGRIKHSDKPINGKVIVYIIGDYGEPVIVNGAAYEAIV